MSSEYLWPAGGIIATLISPFAPAMGTRLVNWARHRRLVGPIIRYLFPEEEGPHPNQRDGVPQVGLDADSLARLSDALRDAQQGGPQADGDDQISILTELQSINRTLQQLLVATEGMRDEVSRLNAGTYTITSTITQAH